MIVSTLILSVIISLSHGVTVRKENSLSGPYTDETGSLVNWDLTGSAQLGESYIRLTTDEEYKQGAIWNNYPSYSNNWEFQVHFHIHGKGVHLNGNGLAIWYVKDADTLHGGPVFGSKDFYSGLGVFIDTFARDEEPHTHVHPFISAVVNNGTIPYVHDSDGTSAQIGGCHFPIRNLEVPTKIAVSYINNGLGIYLDTEGIGQWKMCFRTEGVFLPTGYFLGISASTTDVTDNHDVIAATLLNLDPDDQEWKDNSHVVPHAEYIQVPIKHRREIRDDLQHAERRETEQAERIEHGETSSDIEDTPPTSLLRKLIYITGVALIVLVSISMCKKYNERKRERMQKRLY